MRYADARRQRMKTAANKILRGASLTDKDMLLFNKVEVFNLARDILWLLEQEKVKNAAAQTVVV